MFPYLLFECGDLEHVVLLMSLINIILHSRVDNHNMFEYVDENPVLRVTIYDKTTTYLNCTIIYWYKVVFLPRII